MFYNFLLKIAVFYLLFSCLGFNLHAITLKEASQLKSTPYYTGIGGIFQLRPIGYDGDSLFYYIEYLGTGAPYESCLHQHRLYSHNIKTNKKALIDSLLLSSGCDQHDAMALDTVVHTLSDGVDGDIGDFPELEYQKTILMATKRFTQSLKQVSPKYTNFTFSESDEVYKDSSITFSIHTISEEPLQAELIAHRAHHKDSSIIKLNNSLVVRYKLAGYFYLPDQSKKIIVITERLQRENIGFKLVGYNKMHLKKIDEENWRFTLYESKEEKWFASFPYSPRSYVDVELLIELNDNEKKMAKKDRQFLIDMAIKIRDDYKDYFPRALKISDFTIEP